MLGRCLFQGKPDARIGSGGNRKEFPYFIAILQPWGRRYRFQPCAEPHACCASTITDLVDLVDA
jgi:hypothetical protein